MRKNIGRFAVALALAGVSFAVPACAQSTYGYDGYGRGDRGGYNQNIQRRAFDEGYRRGFDRGRDDLRHRRRDSFDRDREYRNGDRGYRRNDGPREAYRDSFRRGFRSGYNDAFRDSRYDRGGRR